MSGASGLGVGFDLGHHFPRDRGGSVHSEPVFGHEEPTRISLIGGARFRAWPGTRVLVSCTCMGLPRPLLHGGFSPEGPAHSSSNLRSRVQRRVYSGPAVQAHSSFVHGAPTERRQAPLRDAFLEKSLRRSPTKKLHGHIGGQPRRPIRSTLAPAGPGTICV